MTAAQGDEGRPSEQVFDRQGESLSARLRRETRPLHEDVEAKLELPQAIRGASDYVACLRRFHSLYRPIERRLQAFPDWAEQGIPFGQEGFTDLLAADLARLQPGAPLPADAPEAACPALPSFAHALGARYVLEGATLGGEVILRQLRNADVNAAATAFAFFGASRREAGASWRGFRDALDGYGRNRASQADDVVIGAERTFRAFGEWMQSRAWRGR